MDFSKHRALYFTGIMFGYLRFQGLGDYVTEIMELLAKNAGCEKDMETTT